MFTGIVEELGSAVSLSPQAKGARLTIRCQTVLADAAPGCSIAVNGVCLTAIDLRPTSFSADLAPETLSRTNLGMLAAGSSVNLERPLAPTGRLSGHIVQGHVDDTGEFVSLSQLGGEHWWLKIRVPPTLDRYLVFKGSICIDGISLTVASLESDILGVTIIPHTFANTTLGSYKAGARVNLECDIVAKYVEKMMEGIRVPSGITIGKLKDAGFI